MDTWECEEKKRDGEEETQSVRAKRHKSTMSNIQRQMYSGNQERHIINNDLFMHQRSFRHHSVELSRIAIIQYKTEAENIEPYSETIIYHCSH